MNLTNTTTEVFELLLYPDDNDDEGYDDYEDDGIADKVGVVPRHAYLGIIYFILIFGSIGNSCIIALMQAKDFRNMSYSVYLQVLAVSDTLLLITVGVEDILDHQYRLLGDFMTSSTELCKFWNYISYALRMTSPWLVVGMTTDRFVAVVFPLKRSVLCSRRTATVVSSILVVAVFCESILYIILSKPIKEDGGCDMTDWKGLGTYLIFRSLVLETTLPCVFILGLNIYIIIVINRSRKFRAEAAGLNQQRGQEKPSLVDKTTVSLMAVSLMAFVALVPISCLQVAEWQMENEISRREARIDHNDTDEIQALDSLVEDREKLGDYWPALNLVFLFNFGHNFYVMFLTGPRFRQKVFSWFRCFRCVRMRLHLRKEPSSQTTFNSRHTEESKVEDKF